MNPHTRFSLIVMLVTCGPMTIAATPPEAPREAPADRVVTRSHAAVVTPESLHASATAGPRLVQVELYPHVARGPVAIFDPAVPDVLIRRGRAELRFDPRHPTTVPAVGTIDANPSPRPPSLDALPQSNLLRLARQAWYRHQPANPRRVVIIRNAHVATPLDTSDIANHHTPAVHPRFIVPRPAPRMIPRNAPQPDGTLTRR